MLDSNLDPVRPPIVKRREDIGEGGIDRRFLRREEDRRAVPDIRTIQTRLDPEANERIPPGDAPLRQPS